MPNLRIGSKAEVKASNIDVRSTPESGHGGASTSPIGLKTA
jgi:hypothetical protein